MQGIRLWWVIVMVGLAACGTPPTPVPSPTPIQGMKETPSVRTVPTLPPAWTATFTPTITPTPTATPTPTVTLTPEVTAVCANVSLELDNIRDVTLTPDGFTLITLGNPYLDGSTRLVIRPPEGEAREITLPGGANLIVQFNNLFQFENTSGIYEWTVSISAAGYTNICTERGSFTLIFPPPATATEQSSLLQELLSVIVRRVGQDQLTPTPTSTIISTPSIFERTLILTPSP